MKCIMWYCVLDLVSSVSTFSWMRSAHVLENFINTTKKIFVIVLLRSLSYVSLSPPLPRKHANVCHTKSVFILYERFLFAFKSIHLKYLKSGPKFDHIISNDMSPHIFISKFKTQFPCFFVTYLDKKHSCMWQFLLTLKT